MVCRVVIHYVDEVEVGQEVEHVWNEEQFDELLSDQFVVKGDESLHCFVGVEVRVFKS